MGEIAICDHCSSRPGFEELRRVGAEARVGGMTAEVIDRMKTGFAPEDILQSVTSDPATRAGIYPREESIAEGKDADVPILNGDYVIDAAPAKGHMLIQREKRPVKGTFERYA